MTKHQYIIRITLICVLLLMHSTNTTGANGHMWPQFRGPNASGHAAEGQNPPVEFGPEQNLLWKTPLPSGHSSPCIWGNHIFLTGYNKEKKKLEVFCIERSSGNIRWTRIVHTEQIEKVHSINSPATATPATDGERIYLYFGSYGLLCYDFEGSVQWTVPLPIPKTRLNFGTGTSPIISGELVILNSDEQNDPHLLAVDRHSGKTVWKQPQPPAASALSAFGATSYSTPVVWGHQLVIHRTGEIVAYAAEDGARVWSVGAVTNGTSTPVIGNNVLYIGTWSNLGEPELRIKLPDFQMLVEQYDKNGDMQISKMEFPGDLAVSRRPETGKVFGGEVTLKPFFNMFDQNKNGSIDEIEWKGVFALLSALSQEHGLVAIKPGGKDDITRTHILWQEKRNVPEVPAPLYYKGRVYMIKNGGIVSCMNANSGKLLYRERLGASGPYYSSPICADGRIYIASNKGVFTAFAAGDTLRVFGRNDLKERIFATPAIVDNKIYVRTAKHLYAFGE
jgi:outer membrane protein assembly factor BamB